MAFEVRNLTVDEMEAAALISAQAFGAPMRFDIGPHAERMKSHYPPEDYIGAFEDGELTAFTHIVPRRSRINGASLGFGAVSPVASSALHRRKGHAAAVLRRGLEQMRDRGQVLSGLFTPHDALYRRYGWERAESKMQYQFPPRDVKLRTRPAGGHTVPGDPDDWERLAAMYNDEMRGRNGPYKRIPVWWSESILHDYDGPKRQDREVVLWLDDQGRDRGYLIYQDRNTGQRAGGWDRKEIWVRDFVALDSDAYLGLWSHLLTHDLADNVVAEVRPDDPFPDLTYEPQKITAQRREGPMVRVIDLEKAFAQRPYPGERPAAFTMRVEDRTAPWNDGTWRVEAADGATRAQRANGEADVELSANFVAPLFTGYVTPETAARTGMMRVLRAEALEEMSRALVVTDIPYSQDFY
jgi:predicted acetyltransferase